MPRATDADRRSDVSDPEAGLDAARLARELLAAMSAAPGSGTAGLHRILSRARVAPRETEDVLAAVEEARTHAARLRRRATELEALFSTARELVRLQDVGDVLRRLVDRAHALMGTDVTYLSEIDPESGAIRVRHSVGTVTPEFRNLHVPPGIGLASRITRTREPAWVARYDLMRDAEHDPGIDAVVEAEGLVAFLGVPLAVGDEVLGALFACNRFAHDFTPDDVLLLSAFADHAAAVLHSARAIADREAATARAEEAYRSLESHLAATVAASETHEELATAVISGGSVLDLVATLARRLGRPVWALDPEARVLPGGREGRGALPDRRSLADAARRSLASGHAEELERDTGRWIVAAIPGADRVVGSIVTEDAPAPLDETPRRMLERAAHIAALVSFKRDAVAAIRSERRAAYLLDVIAGSRTDVPAGDPELRTTAPIAACAVIDTRDRGAHVLALAAEVVADDGLVAQRDGRVIVAWGAGDGERRTDRLRRTLAERLREPGVAAVVTRVDGSPSGIAAGVERALRDLAYLPALGVSGVTTTSDAFAPYHVLTSAAPGSVEAFVAELIGPVLDWDARRGTRLFDTLCAYFDAGESRTDAAAQLRIHKNTVQQRLERVETLIGGPWPSAEYRFRVHAAVRLERVRRGLAAPPAR